MKTILQYLNEDARFRERANKNKGIANMLKEKYQVLSEVDRNVVLEIIGDCINWERQWRDILLKNESLRGSDYDKKTILEQEKMLELGYEPNHYNDVRKLKTL